MRTAQLGVMTVMMVVRTAPNTARAQDQDAEDSHENVRRARVRQDGAMLLIVINHEQPQKQKPRQKATRDFCRRMEVPDGSGHGQ